MKYKIELVDTDSNYDKLLVAYYEFFEKIYGKYPTSHIIHRKLENGGYIHPMYVFMDSNLGYARDAIKECENNDKIVMMGAYDENEVLAAVCRMRNVFEGDDSYICVSEVLPLIKRDLGIVTGVIKSIEEGLEGEDVFDYLSFEVPIKDTDFQKSLLSMGYDLVQTGKETTTVLYDKKLQRDLDLK